MKACPLCAEQIQDAAVVCRFCGATLKPNVLTSPDQLDAPVLVRDRRRGRTGAIVAIAAGVLLVGLFALSWAGGGESHTFTASAGISAATSQEFRVGSCAELAYFDRTTDTAFPGNCRNRDAHMILAMPAVDTVREHTWPGVEAVNRLAREACASTAAKLAVGPGETKWAAGDRDALCLA